MCAALRQMAFEQSERLDCERRAGEPCVAEDEALRITAAPAKAGERDVRQVSAFLCGEARYDTGPVNFAVKLFQRVAGLNRRPYRAGASLALKLAEACERDLES